jgi:hypothetical protein
MSSKPPPPQKKKTKKERKKTETQWKECGIIHTRSCIIICIMEEAQPKKKNLIETIRMSETPTLDTRGKQQLW